MAQAKRTLSGGMAAVARVEGVAATVAAMEAAEAVWASASLWRVLTM